MLWVLVLIGLVPFGLVLAVIGATVALDLLLLPFMLIAAVVRCVARFCREGAAAVVWVVRGVARWIAKQL